MRLVTCAVTQFACGHDRAVNVDKAESIVRAAAAKGAQLILLQELFEGLYFCQEQKSEYFSWAQDATESPLLKRMSALAAELKVVLPISFFERANNAYFNSIAIIDVDGTNLGLYRKTHIPDGIGYQEKFYFIPGDTGFKVFSTAYGKIGVAICWDQWFPETARCLALQGAEVLLYPTAIGSEPKDATMNSYPHWAKTMIGHACANMVPVMASNRIGKETFEASEITFYGGSFIAGPTGTIMAQVGGQGADGNIDPNPNKEEGFAMAQFDLDALIPERAAWGLFRDRRPEMYGPIATSDGRVGK